ncbi:type II toxin-antitoxin system Phd/YefM family antitoxin [Hyphobacterium sp. CCMP332]|uniref:type II toxin-antitoxin system Phd/YefM family antitoxin n=1 Tax=Hyphobacterium sp. CCMP332 TaxID=2749086 RepID=UPI00164F2556|nr:type II toxin-antitoxin system prevent-host-death family antitoxin [Hyphobacterium sp. CCMP332]QNL18532.1 type II toxin-antitoxin system Phd/YefM family antitoxin [Hyphobacterium sp. CCMP332]
MKTYTATEAKNKFGQLLDDAQRGPVRIEKHGRGSSYVVSEADYEIVQAQKERALRDMLAESQRDIDAGWTIPMEQVHAEVREMLEQAKLDAES